MNSFNDELFAYIAGKLPKSHVFNLGLPGEILKKCGFPENKRIEMSASRLEFKAKLQRHPFDLADIAGLDNALQTPVAVFAYGDRNKAQNIVVGISKDGKNFLAGVHFYQEKNGFEISTIRTIYPKENVEWLNWINQGKMIYGNKEKIQALVAQQRMNGADVSGKVVQSPLDEHCLDSVLRILQKFGNVKDIFTDGCKFYEELAEESSIEQKFYAFYTEKGNIDARILSHCEAEEFYAALKFENKAKIREYTETNLHDISDLAKEIAITWEKKHTKCAQEEKRTKSILDIFKKAIKKDKKINKNILSAGTEVGATHNDSTLESNLNLTQPQKKTILQENILTKPICVNIDGHIIVCEKGILKKLKDTVRQAAKLLKENVKLKEKLTKLTRNAEQNEAKNIKNNSNEWDDRR